MGKFFTLVISMKERTDRREYVSNILGKNGDDFFFVDANRPQDLPENMQNSAIAIWSSHVLALKKFLQSRSQVAVILEDDVYLENKNVMKIFSNPNFFVDILGNDISILQLGTMNFENTKKHRALLSKTYFRVHGYYRYDFGDLVRAKCLLGKIKFKELNALLTKFFDQRIFLLSGFKIGSQAYIVNRSGAEWIIRDFEARGDWDLTSRFSLDTMLEELGGSAPGGPRIFRISNQLLPQRVTHTDNNVYGT